MRARIAMTMALVLSAGVVAGCSPEEPPPAAEALQPQLDLSDSFPDDVMRIGVLVPPIEGAGSEFRPLVEGARVAAYRFELGGAEIEFRVALDDGTVEGAREAMESLVQQEVAGVVLAAPEADITEAVQVAAEAGTAVVLPYGHADEDISWSVAPSADAVLAQVKAALTEESASRPYLAAAEGRELGLDTVHTATLADPGPMAEQIVAMLEAREIDSVVVDGPAADQAALVIALQGRLGSRQLPIILTPEALTPQFGDLLSAGGTTAGWLYSMGTDTGDHVALRDTEAGEQAAVFFAALRLAAGDGSCENIYGDDSCAAGIGRADIASHDATVALIRAIEAAESTDPARVRSALHGMVLDHEHGVVGPTLDFGEAQALSDADVVLVRASTSDPGLRPQSADGQDAAALFWFTGSSQ